ncbi:general transcription factor IIF subunit 2-like [Arctopsyche grandis]|uniref:general transcription factor IIF subunit 2-like n=1 Tax=Arctopsyche grandis TaxID=121162 RepID=UPI00406D939D
MYLISNDKKKMYIEGTVNKECFVQPVVNAEYLKFKRSLKETENEKVKVLDYFAEVKRNGKYSSLREMEVLAKKRKQMLQEKKRERLEREDVLEILFNAFEKHDLWTVRDLADFSGQPVAYIQELVNEV